MPSRGEGAAMARAVPALAILSVVMPLAFFASFAWLIYDSYVTAARQQLVRTVDVLREHAIKVFETHVLVATQVEQIVAGLTDEKIRAEEDTIGQQMRTLSSRLDQIQDIWIVDRHGNPLAAANVYPVPRDLDLSDREYFRVFRDGLLNARQTYVSEVLVGRAQQVTFFQVSRQRSQEKTGGFNGVIAVSVQPLYFQEFYRQVAAGGFDTMTLIRDDGVVLARYPALPGTLSRLPPGSAFARRVREVPDQGVYETASAFDGVKRLIAYQRLPNLPVYVTAGIDRGTIQQQWAAALGRQLIFVIPATLALLALSLLALRFTRRERQALDQVRAEAQRRERAEAQLRQAQKMEAVGRLTGGVAHDFNNLLTIIIGNLELLKGFLLKDGTGPGDPRIVRCIDHAEQGAQRAAQLTQNLLAFSRQQPLRPVPVDANRLVAGMSDLLRRTLGETVNVETVLAGGLWLFSADVNQLESVILNLAVNARDAMRDGGKLTIETANAHLDDAYAAAHEDVAAGQYVLIAVSDTGSGMAREVMEQAFEPFFTTKPAGEGTGLGLSQAYGFVKQSGGHIAIYSEPGHGTTIKLYLPKLDRDCEDQEPLADSPAVRAGGTGGGIAVLAVEDDPMVRRFGVEALEGAGYRVLAAGDGASGLARLKAHPEIRLLFTDVVLTGSMNGRALADEALNINPCLKVLFTTGYTRNAIIHHGRLDDGVNFIGKPFSAAALVDKVQQILAAD